MVPTRPGEKPKRIPFTYPPSPDSESESYQGLAAHKLVQFTCKVTDGRRSALQPVTVSLSVSSVS